MPRGSKPGERRGGRRRATPNKRTILTDRILAVASANPTASYDEIVAILVKDQALAADVRVAIARKWFAGARSQSAKGRTKKGNDHGLKATERTAPTKSDRGVTSTTPPSTTGASPDASTQTTRAMLPVLLGIVQDSTTTPAERRQAALKLGQYFLPKKHTQKRSHRGKLVRDQYGFEVNPDVARELRDTKLKLACLPLSKRKFTPYTIAQKASKLQARIKEIQELLQCPCPSKYRFKNYICVDGIDTVIDGEIVRDKERLKILAKRRVDKTIFSREEDLEEAIRTARYDSYIEGPEMAARYRLAELREKKRAADKRYGPPFTPAQDAAFRVLTLLYPPLPNPEPSEIQLADHPFRDLPAADYDTVSSRKAPKRPASTNPQPDPDEDFVEFVDVPPFATVDRELSEREGRTILKWTYEI
jgi:hypothetical protein